MWHMNKQTREVCMYIAKSSEKINVTYHILYTDMEVGQPWDIN